MKELQSLFAGLDRDARGGMLLPTAQLVEAFKAARPLDQEKLHFLAQCLVECSEQIYEHYRVLIDIFREEIRRITPDDDTLRTGIALGIVDDEDWEV